MDTKHFIFIFILYILCSESVSVNLKVVEPVLVMQFIILISNLLFSFIRLIIIFSSYYLFIFFLSSRSGANNQKSVSDRKFLCCGRLLFGRRTDGRGTVTGTGERREALPDI